MFAQGHASNEENMKIELGLHCSIVFIENKNKLRENQGKKSLCPLIAEAVLLFI